MSTTTIRPLVLPAELRNVKWTGNVRPVDDETRRAVLDQFTLGQSARPAGFPSHGLKADGSPRFALRCRDVRLLTDRATEPLALLAAGYTMADVAMIGRTNKNAVLRLVAWLAQYHAMDLDDIRDIGRRADDPAEIPQMIRDEAGVTEPPDDGKHNGKTSKTPATNGRVLDGGPRR